MESMKRLGIFIFYDPNGHVDNYVCYLLGELKRNLNKMIIVSNSKLLLNDRKILEKYTEDVYERENNGYDAAAYKYCFDKILSEEELGRYDELFMVNDSFYGPLFSWEPIINYMEKQPIDYWGLTSNDNAIIKGEKCIKHIQSYFLVLKKQVFLNGEFTKFWEKMTIPQNLDEAIVEFEIGIANWLTSRGFIGSSYLDIVGECYVDNEKNPYIEFAYELISECKIPILKRKSLDIAYTNIKKVEKIMDFIQNETKYNVEWIWDNYYKREGKYLLELKKFCSKYNHIYVYGAGKVGNNYMDLLRYWGITKASFIVSSNEKRQNDIQRIDDVVFSETDGIIIGVGKRFADEVYNNAIRYISVSDIFYIGK